MLGVQLKISVRKYELKRNPDAVLGKARKAHKKNTA